MIRNKQIESQLSGRMLDWYDKNRRELPWRSPPGKHSDPYHVWLSEIMLQQTTVATVKDYYRKFLSLWPTVNDMAAAPLDDILSAWAGLGYYARARNLHKCARHVSQQLNGHFPDNHDDLLTLPGIGPYTAAAIASIAFGEAATVVDGNIERVMSRLFACTAELPKERSVFYQLAGQCTPQMRPGDYAQSLMDLGATICTPRSPKCMLCPAMDLCLGKDMAETLPRKVPKKKKPTRAGIAFWIEHEDGRILLERRPEKGLLGGMTGFPGSPWQEGLNPEFTDHLPISGLEYQSIDGMVKHTFTHFHLELRLYFAQLPAHKAPNQLEEAFFWADQMEMDNLALPTVMKKLHRLGRDFILK